MSNEQPRKEDDLSGVPEGVPYSIVPNDGGTLEPGEILTWEDLANE